MALWLVVGLLVVALWRLELVVRQGLRLVRGLERRLGALEHELGVRPDRGA